MGPCLRRGTVNFQFPHRNSPGWCAQFSVGPPNNFGTQRQPNWPRYLPFSPTTRQDILVKPR